MGLITAQPVDAGLITKRYIRSCYDQFGNDNCGNGTWNSWARWLVFALIIVAAFLIFFIFSCVSARRRRRLGYQPYRGTGWAQGRTPAGSNAPTMVQQEQPYYNNSNNPPPAYTPPPNTGYYGRNDVELQQPQQVYGGYNTAAQGVYEPPKAPPPGRS